MSILYSKTDISSKLKRNADADYLECIKLSLKQLIHDLWTCVIRLKWKRIN